MKTSYILVAIHAPTVPELKRKSAVLRHKIHTFAEENRISIADNSIPPADFAAGWAQDLLANIMTRRVEWPE